MSSAVRPSSNTAVSPPRALPVSVVAASHVETSRIYGTLALFLTAIALALRLFHIDRESLWLDEGYTLFFSQLPLKQLLLIGGAHEHPPLYYVIVHLLLAVHPWFLVTRYVSAIAGALSVLVLYWLGRRMFGPLAGLCAAALLTISPFQVWWSRDARAYELAGLFVLLSYLTVLRALEMPRRRTWLAYSLCVALCLYSEYTTAFVLLPQMLLLLRACHRRLRASLIGSWIIAALLFAPWLTVLSRDAASVASDYWIPAPSWGAMENTVLEFLGLITPCPSFPCVGSEAFLPILAGHESWIAASAVFFVVMVALYGLLARRLEWIMTALWLTLPFLIVLVLAVRRSLYLDRVFLDATFALYLLLAGMAARVRGKWRAVVSLLLLGWLTAGSIANLRLVYSQSSNPDWRGLARDLRVAYRPGQAVIFNPAVLRALVGAYLPGNWHASREQLLWFHGYLDVPGWQSRFAALKAEMIHDSRIVPQVRYGHFDAVLRDVQLEQAIRGERQVWLVTQDYAGVTDNRRWLNAHGFHLLLSEIYYGDARLELWDRGEPRDFGPVVLSPGFGADWKQAGLVKRERWEAIEQGHAQLARSFSVASGATYVVNVQYRGLPGSFPGVRVHVYDQAGHVLGQMVDRFGGVLDSFPRTEWYDMPVNGVWLSQPFGFVAPAGAFRAVMTLSNESGICAWRNIGVYRER